MDLNMSQTNSVKVSSRYQIAVPASARSTLKIKRGDRLLVDVQDGMIILLPQPMNYTKQLAGLHQSIWEDDAAVSYIREEREAWEESRNA